MPRLLELFSGTGSIGRAFAAKGWEVVSVDLDPKFEPTICCDVMQLDERSLGSFDMVWASPVCTEYSRALSRRPRDLETGDRLVLRTLEIMWDYNYRKATRIWHNLPWEPSQPMRRKGSCCHAFADGRHPEAAQRRTTNGRRNQQSREQLYSIPPRLCDEIAAAVS